MLCVISPFHLVLITLFIILTLRSTSVYVNVSTELKRMNQIALSPLISTVGEIIAGHITIRQYRKKEWMHQKFIQHLDLYTVTQGHLNLTIPYLRVRIKYLLMLVITLSVAALFFNKRYRFILF